MCSQSQVERASCAHLFISFVSFPENSCYMTLYLTVFKMYEFLLSSDACLVFKACHTIPVISDWLSNECLMEKAKILMCLYVTHGPLEILIMSIRSSAV